MTQDQLNLSLQAEYLQLQKTIEDFDARALTIKAWSVTFSLVAIGGAFVSHATVILLVASGSALLFWLLEAIWKQFQYSYYSRSRSIEEHFRGGSQLNAPFQIGTSWSSSWNTDGKRLLLRIAFWPQVAVPHLIVAALGFAIFLMNRFALIKI